MISEKKNRLINILSIPSYYGQEEKMASFIRDFLTKNGIYNYSDGYGNVYAIKGISGKYPCILAHMDTVHKITEFAVHENDGKLFALTRNNKKTGIGGDNKTGIFICLELLLELDNIKAAFFVAEEIGCIGSKLSDRDFFKDVGYAIQFDAPGNELISVYSDGIKLFDENSDFFNKVHPMLREINQNYLNEGDHPYTDVSALRILYDFQCLNIASGYENMHSDDEIVIISDVNLSLERGKKLIKILGNEFYYMQNSTENKILIEANKLRYQNILNGLKI